jgi:hypothetical protein
MMSTPRWMVTPPATENPFLEEMRHTGDPLADHTAETIYGLGEPEKVSRLLTQFVENDQVPEGLPEVARHYLEESRKLPEWAEPRRIEIAEKVFIDHGLTAYALLGCASLPESYAILDATRVLGRTMRLEDELITRRIMETSLFVLDVMSPGGLGHNGRGIATARKVRLMHAAMRYLLLRRAPMAALRPPAAAWAEAAEEARGKKTLAQALREYPWDEKAWGVPIHQVAMTAAILSFSYIVLRGLRDLGVRLTREQESAYLHAWNVMGHVMGVREELLLSRPETMEEAHAQYMVIWQAHKRASEDGPKLAKALLEFEERTFPWPLRRVPRILTWYLLGQDTSRLLKLPALDWQDRLLRPPLLFGFRLTNALAEWDALRFLRPAKVLLFRGAFQAQLARARGGNRPTYEMPDSLKEAWRFRGLIR